jgi:hypothetical protein
MKSWFVRIGLAVALISAGYLIGHWSVPAVHAQQVINANVPKSMGHFVVATGTYFYFEDSAGTIRLIDVSQNAHPQIVVTRQ